MLLVLPPVWHGHMFNNPKDLPLREHLWRTERERYLAGPYVVSACMPGCTKSAGRRPSSGSATPATIVIPSMTSSPELTRVEREGTLLALIRDLRSEEARDRVTRSTRKTTSARPARPKRVRKPMRRSRPKLKPTSKPVATNEGKP